MGISQTVGVKWIYKVLFPNFVADRAKIVIISIVTRLYTEGFLCVRSKRGLLNGFMAISFYGSWTSQGSFFQRDQNRFHVVCKELQLP